MKIKCKDCNNLKLLNSISQPEFCSAGIWKRTSNNHLKLELDFQKYIHEERYCSDFSGNKKDYSSLQDLIERVESQVKSIRERRDWYRSYMTPGLLKKDSQSYIDSDIDIDKNIDHSLEILKIELLSNDDLTDMADKLVRHALKEEDK